MKLNAKALALSAGILWGAAVLGWLLAWLYNKMGKQS